MKRPISLKWFVAVVFLGLGGLLVIGYSLLSAQFFKRGMDNMVAAQMERVARDYVSGGTTGPGEIAGYRIARRWDDVPAATRTTFGHPPAEADVLRIHDDARWFQPPQFVRFLMRVRAGRETVFVSHTVSPETASALVARNAKANLRLLFGISVASALVLAGVILLVLRRVSRPVAALGAWARDLDARRLREPPPDFAYPELNELAALIRGSLSSVHEALEREHRFLRHTSHELRTPISVIRSNIELMHRLQEQLGGPADPRQAQVIERIDRASQTMKQLTEVLLWLSRVDESPPAARHLRLDELLRQITGELAYLLTDKPVTVALATEPYTVHVPEGPARIVLGNLVRNAFQHTWDGQVHIRQRGDRVLIVNPRPVDGAGGNDGDELGFGLGLQLTARLTSRLGWAYRNRARRHHRVVRLRFGTAGNTIERPRSG